MLHFYQIYIFIQLFQYFFLDTLKSIFYELACIHFLIDIILNIVLNIYFTYMCEEQKSERFLLLNFSSSKNKLIFIILLIPQRNLGHFNLLLLGNSINSNGHTRFVLYIQSTKYVEIFST